MEEVRTVTELFRAVAETLESAESEPYGRPAGEQAREWAGKACLELAGGDRDGAVALWRQLEQDCNGYMPQAVALALYRASKAKNVVTPDEAPDIDAPRRAA